MIDCSCCIGGGGGGEVGCVGAVVVLTGVAVLLIGFVALMGWMLRDAGVI